MQPYTCSRIDSVRSIRPPSSALSDESVGDTLEWKKGNRLGKGSFGTVSSTLSQLKMIFNNK